MPGIPSEVLWHILAGDHLFYDPSSQKAAAVRESHFIPPEGIHTSAEGGAAALVRARTAQMTTVVDDFLKRMTREGQDDSPPLSDLDLDDAHEQHEEVDT